MKSLKILIHVISRGTVPIFHLECYFITNHVNWQLIVTTLFLWSLCKLTADQCMISWGVGNRKSCIQTSVQFISHPRPHSFLGLSFIQPHLLLPVCTANPVTHKDIGLSRYRSKSAVILFWRLWKVLCGVCSPPQSLLSTGNKKNIGPEEIKFSKFQSKAYVGKVSYISVLCHPPNWRKDVKGERSVYVFGIHYATEDQTILLRRYQIQNSSFLFSKTDHDMFSWNFWQSLVTAPILYSHDSSAVLIFLVTMYQFLTDEEQVKSRYSHF